MNNYGVMQGRLIPDENGRIQSFPKKGWRSEFPLLKSLGISYLEWTIDKEDLWKNPLLTTDGLNQVIDLSHKNDVKIISTTGDNLMQAPIHKKVAGVSTSIAECQEFIGKLAVAGIEILVWPLVDAGNLDNRFEFDLFIEKFSPLVSFIEEKGIKVAFETDLNSQENLELITSFRSNSIGINADIGNLASYGHSISEEFELLESSIFHVHVKDRVYGGNTVPLGEGSVKWHVVSQVLNKHYAGIKVLQAARKTNPVATIREYLNFCEMMSV